MGKTGTTRTEVDLNYNKGMIGNIAATDPDFTTSLSKARFGVFAYYTAAKDYRGETTTPAPYDWTTSNASGTWKKDETNKYPNFMFNEQLKYDDAKGWLYDNVKYWPNGIDAANSPNSPSNTAGQKEEGKLSFFAFAPYMEEGTGSTNVGTPPTEGVQGTITAADVKTPKEITYTLAGGSSTTVKNGVVAMTTNSSQSNVWVKYVMPVASDKDAVDLLWGVRGQKSYRETDGTDNTETALGKVYNENLTKQVVDERVKFLFKHALAKIGGSTTTTTETTTGNPSRGGLKVVVDIDKNSNDPKNEGQSNQTTYFASDFSNTKTLVTLKSVKIQDARSAYEDRENNGISTTATVTDYKSSIANEGWFNIEEGEWAGVKVTDTDAGGSQYNVVANNENTDLNDDTYTLNEAIKETGAAKSTEGTKKVVSGYTWTTPTNPVGVTTTPQDVFCNENVPGLLVIPGSSQDIYFTVDYIVRTADSKLAAGYSEVEQVITNKVNLGGLESNKYYTIIMHLGLTSVKFEAVVADWVADNGTEFNEDGTEVEPTTPTENREVVWLPSNVVTASVAETIDATYSADKSVTLTGLEGTELTVVAVDGTVVASTTDVTDLTVTSGSATVSIKYTTNTTTSNRTGWVKLSDGTKTITINLTQDAGALTMGSVSKDTGIAAAGEDITISDVKAGDVNVPTGTHTITIAATQTGGTFASETLTGTISAVGELTITVPANTGAAATWTITSITIDDATYTPGTAITLNQNAYVAP